ncbi:MAG: ABC transporter permease [Desulfobacterales bacterium]
METEKSSYVEPEQTGPVTSRQEKIPPEKELPSIGPKFTPPKDKFFGLRVRVQRNKSVALGVVGCTAFFAIWEIAHYTMPEAKQRFLPSVEHVIATAYYLLAEKGFMHDIAKSCYRIFVSFFAASAIAIPLGIGMGCFAHLRAMINPSASGFRYLPAASFIPLLLVWFGPTDLAKMGLLFIGVIFFLISLILDSTDAVPIELTEASLTMGASPRQVVLGVITPAAAPAILDSMRNMIAVGWTYLVIAEIVGANDGIGAVMMRAGRFLHVDIIMAGIFTIGILGVLTDSLFRLVSRLAFGWNIPQRG